MSFVENPLDDGLDAVDKTAEPPAPAPARQFGVEPPGYVMPEDVALLNKIRRAMGAYPASLATTGCSRLYSYAAQVVVTIICIQRLFNSASQFANHEGRMGSHSELTPTLIVGESTSTDEPPLRVPMDLPDCRLCGSSIDVAVQFRNSPHNYKKGRNDPSGRRYVWNGPLTEEYALSAEEVGTGAIYGYRWRYAKLRQGAHVHNSTVLFEVVSGVNLEFTEQENSHFAEPLTLTLFGELTSNAQQFCSLSSCQTKIYPLRRRSRHRTAAEVKWSVPANLEQRSLADSACDDAVCVETPDISPILNELTALPDWNEDSAVVLFATVEGSGMRQIVMMHDNTLYRLTNTVNMLFCPSVLFGFLALRQIDFTMGIFDISDDLERKIRRAILIVFGLQTSFQALVMARGLLEKIPLGVYATAMGLASSISFAVGLYCCTLYMAVYLTTSYHAVARVTQVRALLTTRDAPFFRQDLKTQCLEMQQLNNDLRAVTQGPIFKALFWWICMFIAMGYNNFAKLTADSDQPTEWNVLGFLIVMGILTSGLLVPARVTTECSKLMADLNSKYLEFGDNSPDKQLRLLHLDRYIRSLNSGDGLGFFLFDIPISESLVKSVASLASTLALAYATGG